MYGSAGVTAINPLLVALPIVGALCLLGYFGWKRHKRQEERARQERERQERIAKAKIPAGATPLCTGGGSTKVVDQSGRLMLVLDGTFGANVGGLSLLTLLERCGLAGTIGSILLIELDSHRRERFLKSVPSAFQDRIVPVSCPALSGGMGNRHPQEVMTLIDRWGPPVIKAAHEICEVHQRRHKGEEAALALTFISQGGQALLGTKAVEVIGQEFRQAQFFGFSALPVDDRLLSRVEPILDAYRQVGVKGFVLSSNLLDEVKNDFGMVAAITGFASAAEQADAAIEQNNAWNLLFSEDPGGIVSCNVYMKRVPGYRFQPDASLVPEYYVYKDSIVSAILTALEEVKNPRSDTLGLRRNGSPPLTSRFDIVLAAVYAEALREHEDAVVMGRLLKGQPKRNYHLLFASIATQINPLRPICPVAVVSLAAVQDAQEALQNLTAPLNGAQRPVARANGDGAPFFEPIEMG